MNKKINIIIVLSFLLIVLLGGAYTYSRYRTETGGKAVAEVANWNITVNDCNIVNPDTNNTECFASEVDEESGNIIVTKNYSITDITYVVDKDSVGTIDPNKIGPGSSGYFDIVIKPNDTQVSINYSLKITFPDDNAIKFSRSDPNEIEQTSNEMEKDGYNGTLYYTRNGFKLNEYDAGTVDSVSFRIYVIWEYTENEGNDEDDTRIGTSSNDPRLNIPVTIEFEQVKE